MFTVEESSNKQNDRLYALSSLHASELVRKVQRDHHSAMLVRSSRSISARRVSQPRRKFIKRTFKGTINYLQMRTRKHGSPDLDPIDYKIWSVLGAMTWSMPSAIHEKWCILPFARGSLLILHILNFGLGLGFSLASLHNNLQGCFVKDSNPWSVHFPVNSNKFFLRFIAIEWPNKRCRHLPRLC